MTNWKSFIEVMTFSQLHPVIVLIKTLLFFLWTKEFLCFSLKDALQAQQAPEWTIQEVCTSLGLAPLSLGSLLASRLVQYTTILPNFICDKTHRKTEGLVRLKSKLVLFTVLHAIYGWAKLKQMKNYYISVCIVSLSIYLWAKYRVERA